MPSSLSLYLQFSSRIALLPSPPSDDVNRYLWEGRIVLDGGNPYSATADDPQWEDHRDDIWKNMNHRDRPTAYPPGIQWILAATAAIHPSLFSFKILALAADLAVLLLIFALLRESAGPVRWAGFYAFNPVVLIAFAAEGHFDSLMVASMLASIISARKEKASAWLWIAVAIQIKVVAIILVPLLLTRESLRSSWLILPVLILPSLPFIDGLPEWIAGIRTFAGSGDFNAPLFTYLALTGIEPGLAKLVCTCVFVMAAIAICVSRWNGADIIRSVLLMTGALLVCSPIVHLWYLTWLLPLTAIRPSFAWTAGSIGIAGYFLAWHTLKTEGWWGFGHGTAALIWLPFILAGVAQNRFAVSKRRLEKMQRTEKGSPSLSVIIPILKPHETLISLLQNLRQALGHSPQMIVVRTESSSLPVPERCITATRGRGNQIAAGIAATSGDWILIVHSDSVPRDGFKKDLEIAILAHPQSVMFVFGQRFDKPSAGTGSYRGSE